MGDPKRWLNPARSNELSDFLAWLLLPTPQAHERTQTPRRVDHGAQLANEIWRLLPTPSAEFTDIPDRRTFLDRRERERAKGRNGNGFGLTLPMALTLLPTPTTMVGSRGRRLDGTPYTPTSGTTLTDALYESAGVHTSPLSTDGKRSSADLVLNPSFVEWMMGAPDGWSDPDCPLSATEFSSRQAGSSAEGSSNTSGVCADG